MDCSPWASIKIQKPTVWGLNSVLLLTSIDHKFITDNISKIIYFVSHSYYTYSLAFKLTITLIHSADKPFPFFPAENV